ncbi:MAG: hypothetical protein ABR506_05730 [Candidatus Krumholzibacteriia bacterium]
MNRSFAEALRRTAWPVLGMLLAKTAFDLGRAGTLTHAADVVEGNTLLMLALWLFVAVWIWLLRKVMPPTP